MEHHGGADVLGIHVLELEGGIELPFSADGNRIAHTGGYQIAAFGLENDAAILLVAVVNRCLVFPLGRQTLLEQVVCFHVVVIGGNDTHANWRCPAVRRSVAVHR